MSRERLLDYQEQEAYVFHGSDNGAITELEPRQALNFKKPDGEPAVFAVATIEPAIFMAILGSRKTAGWDSDTFTPPFGFYASESSWQKAQIEDWTGFVYVLKRDTFTKDKGWVWRSHQAAVPIDKIAVSFSDLPKAVTILSDEAEAAYLDNHFYPANS